MDIYTVIDISIILGLCANSGTKGVASTKRAGKTSGTGEGSYCATSSCHNSQVHASVSSCAGSSAGTPRPPVIPRPSRATHYHWASVSRGSTSRIRGTKISQLVLLWFVVLIFLEIWKFSCLTHNMPQRWPRSNHERMTLFSGWMSIPCRVNSLYATNSVSPNSSSHELCSCSWKPENLCCLTHNIPQQWPRSNREGTLSLGWCWSHQEATLCIIKLQFRGRDDLDRTPSFLPRESIGGCEREWNVNHSCPTNGMATLSGILLFGLRSRKDKNTGIYFSVSNKCHLYRILRPPQVCLW